MVNAAGFIMETSRTLRKDIIEKELSYQLVGIFFHVQEQLGRYCREIQYCDALEQELKIRKIQYQREYSIPVAGRLSNRIDFLIAARVIVDVKAKPFVEREDYDQMRRYLQSANVKLGMIVNFRNKFLLPKRVLNPAYEPHSHNSHLP